jgi:ribosomal protein S18 acetylase RimI-like enzyme
MALLVTRTEEKDTIFQFLSQDRFYAAYAIADLEPAVFRLCEWYVALRNGQMSALCLRFKGLQPNSVFVMGSTEDVSHILDQALRPARAQFATKPDHLGVIDRFYVMNDVKHMLRMILDAPAFAPVDGAVIRLRRDQAHQLRELYGWGSDVAFASYQLDQGIFYGVVKDQKLVSAAGTHLVSRVYGLGIVGNVLTHPDHRGQGYATVCTSAVVEELLSQSLDVVLNVERDNEAATKLYRRLGFRTYCSFVEALATRRYGLRKGATIWPTPMT